MFTNLTYEQIENLQHTAGEYHKLAVAEHSHQASLLHANMNTRNFIEQAARCQSFHVHCEEIHQFRSSAHVELMRRLGIIVK